MKRAIVGILLALTLLGIVAGLSGRQTANQELDHLKDRWADIQAQPPHQRSPAELAQLRAKAEGLATQFPERDEIRTWKRIIEQSWRQWRAYGHNAG